VFASSRGFKRTTIAIAVGGAVGLGGIATDAAAEEAAPPSQLGVVVVTAQKREQDVQDVPAAVTVLSGTVIQADPDIQSTKDIARYVPGATGWNTESRARPRFFIRGIGSNEATNNSVGPIGIYFDEVYFGNNLFQGGPLFDLDRVEVLRGPQGTLWGKNTTGGAFHFVSRKPTFDTGGYGKVQFGDYGQKVFEGAYGGAVVGDTLAARISFHAEDRNGWATNTITGNEVGNLNDFALRGQLLWDLGPKLDVLLDFHLRKFDGSQTPWYPITEAHGPNAFGYLSNFDATGDRGSVAYNANDLPVKVNTHGVTGTINWDLPFARLTSISALNLGDRTAYTDGDYTPREGSRSYGTNSVRQLSEELRLTSTRPGPLQWITGLYYYDESNDSFGASATLPSTGNPYGGGATAYNYVKYTQKLRSHALFGGGSWAVTDALKLNAGLRWTHDSIDFNGIARIATPGPVTFDPSGPFYQPGSVTSPLATFTSNDSTHTWSNLGYDFTPEYKLAKDQLAYFRLAKGYRSGNINTNISPPRSFFSTVDPETLTSYEIGYKSAWLDKRLTFNAAAYYYDYKNIQLVVNHADPSLAAGFYPNLENAAANKVKGVEFEAQYQATPDLLLRANLGALHNRFTEFNTTVVVNGVAVPTTQFVGYHFARVPEVTSLVGGDYTIYLPQGALRLSTDWSYQGFVNFNVQDANNPATFQRAFWLGFVRAAYWFPGDRFGLSAFVNNVTDKEYKIQAFPGVSTPTTVHATAFGEPRTYGVALTVKL
jgi:iron complex outermembrane receptor protein